MTTLKLAGLHALSVGDPDAAKFVVVLLHGFQMEPSDLEPFASSLSLPAWFVFVEGPLPASPRGRAWWYMDAADREKAIARGPRDFAMQHPPDLPAARSHLTAFLDELAPRVGGRPLVVGGFSQGGMLVCDTLIRMPRPLAGIALLSASRIALDEWPPTRLPGLPVLISHGRGDDDLAFAAGEALCDHLAKAGADVTWVPFDEGHEIPLVVWRALRKFLKRASTSMG